jgi:hypothetical protein
MHIAADDPGPVRAELERVMTLWSRRGFHIQHFTAMLATGELDLYLPEGAVAREHMAAVWRPLRRSGLLRVEQLRVMAHQLRGRTSLAAAVEADDPRPALAEAARAARALRRTAVPTAVAMGALVDAGVLGVRGDTTAAAARLADAAALLDGVNMRLFAASARHRRGAIVGGDEGRALIAEAEMWMRAHGIAAPVRMARSCAPGFDRVRR